MGEEADFIIDRAMDDYYNHYSEPSDYQYDGVGLYEWRDTNGVVLKMHHMSTPHLVNAMKFAEPDKKQELFQTILDRCGITKQDEIPAKTPSGLFNKRKK